MMKALSHRKQQKGAVLVLVTIALFTLLGFTALALDGGYLLLNKTRVQDAVDSAALSGAETLDKGGNHNAARQAVEATLTAILSGDGFSRVNIDTGNLAEDVTVEFSHTVYNLAGDKFEFKHTDDEAARYIRVTLPTVPVDQFFSQLLIDIWQVGASAVAGASPTIQDPCQIIPLMMCVNDTNPPDPDYLPDDYDYGFTPSSDSERGDVVVIKVPTNNTPVGPGNFLAVDLGGPGADGYRDGLAGALTDASCIAKGDDITTKTGNMIGPTTAGLNTRFGKYKSPMSEPMDAPSSAGSDAFYADCAVPNLTPLKFKSSDFSSTAGSTVLNDTALLSKLQSYPDYVNKYGSYSTVPNTQHCMPKRRMVKVPVGNCSGINQGKTTVPSMGTACMYLIQEVTGQGTDQFIVAEFVKNCTAEGVGNSNLNNGPYRLVLYKNEMGGDS
ncbi:pilus assembly protein TadG-related protein [Oceanisphaera psychrotolerans]|nr:pilus assembly protein TadG-related protein [Oceanisphaera psychrotolerans]